MKLNPPWPPFFKGGNLFRASPFEPRKGATSLKGGSRGIFIQHGFTLVETVLAMAILAVGILGILFSYQGMSKNTVRANQSTIALNIARGTLERIFAARDANGYSATLSAITSGTYDENPATGFTGYVLDTTGTEVDSDNDNTTDDFLDSLASSGYARVTATVTWNNAHQQVSLVTLMTSY